MRRLLIFLLLVGVLSGVTVRRNFSGQTTPPVIDTEYRRCNFAQPQPDMTDPNNPKGVRIFPGDDTPRTFLGCNLVNCLLPPDSTVIGCNTTIRQSGVRIASRTVVIDANSLSVPYYGSKIYHNGQMIIDALNITVPNQKIDTSAQAYQQALAWLQAIRLLMRPRLRLLEQMPPRQRREWIKNDPLLRAWLRLGGEQADYRGLLE